MIELEDTAQVWCICGNLGGGKTLTGVSMAVQSMFRGYYVVSNVTLNLDNLRVILPQCDKLYQHITVRNEEYDDDGNLLSSVDFNPFSIPSGSPRGTVNGKRVLVLLDECAEWFDQYSNARSNIMKRVRSWLRHTSKRSQDVIFIVQRREFLHKEFRSLVSRWVSVDDLNVWRMPFLHLKIPFCSSFCMANVFDRANIRVQSTQLISKVKYGRYYNTSECLSNFGGKSYEYEVPDMRVKFRWGFLIAYIASIISLCFI